MLISMRGIITDPITFISRYLHTYKTALHEIITKAYYYGTSNTKSYLIHEYYVAANYQRTWRQICYTKQAFWGNKEFMEDMSEIILWVQKKTCTRHFMTWRRDTVTSLFDVRPTHGDHISARASFKASCLLGQITL